jgi:hypothetical protein
MCLLKARRKEKLSEFSAGVSKAGGGTISKEIIH